MKIKLTSEKKPAGYILVLVLILCAASLLILTGVMNYTTTTANLNMRSNQLTLCRNAAEAATEKVFAKMAYDFQAYGLGQVSNNLSVYRTLIPNTNDSTYFSNFRFTDTTNSGYTYVGYLTNYTGPMPTQYTNSFVTTSPIYRIVSNASMPNSIANTVIGTAQEDVLLALVPITTYAIFYNGELEFSGCAAMTVNGRTHSNADICTGTSASCTFNGAVTCCSVIQSPTRGGSYGPYSLNDNTTYNAGSTTNVVSVQISIPMTNTHSIIEIPPVGELPTSIIGQAREYNQAQVVLIVSNSPSALSGPNPALYLRFQSAYNGTVPGNDPAPISYCVTNVTSDVLSVCSNIVTSLILNSITNTVSTTNKTSGKISSVTTVTTTTNTVITATRNASMPYPMSFVTLTNTFTDQREYQTNMLVTQIDVGAYATWIKTNLDTVGKFTSQQGYPTILYVADRRNIGTSQLSVVRLVNATKLPPNNGLGFTVATQNPLYVMGNYNTTVDGSHFVTSMGQTTNGWSVPAALIADAITVLSANWKDSTSATSLINGTPSTTVMDAAIIAGNIPSSGTNTGTFSGGVHNLTRLLENWNGTVSLTYNTSIVCLYASQMATNQFRNTGVTSGKAASYYSAPLRYWGFDPTYYNPAGQPPGVPSALVPIRFNWNVPPPKTVPSS